MLIRKLRALIGSERTSMRRLVTNQGTMLLHSAEQGSTPFRLGELGATHASGGRVILTHARTDQSHGIPNKAEAFGHRMMLVGGLSVTGGLALVATVVFAGAGVLGILFGGVALLSGWLTVFAAKRWPRLSASPTR